MEIEKKDNLWVQYVTPADTPEFKVGPFDIVVFKDFDDLRVLMRWIREAHRKYNYVLRNVFIGSKIVINMPKIIIVGLNKPRQPFKRSHQYEYRFSWFLSNLTPLGIARFCPEDLLEKEIAWYQPKEVPPNCVADRTEKDDLWLPPDREVDSNNWSQWRRAYFEYNWVLSFDDDEPYYDPQTLQPTTKPPVHRDEHWILSAGDGFS